MNKKINPQHRRFPVAADCIQCLQEPLRVLSFAVQLLQRQAGSRTHRSVKIPRPFRTCPDAGGAGNALPHIHLPHVPQINGPHGANLCTGSAVGAVLVGRRVQRQAQRGFVGNGPLDVQRCRLRPQLLNHGAAESVQLAGSKLTEFLYLLEISDVRTARRYFFENHVLGDECSGAEHGKSLVLHKGIQLVQRISVGAVAVIHQADGHGVLAVHFLNHLNTRQGHPSGKRRNPHHHNCFLIKSTVLHQRIAQQIDI